MGPGDEINASVGGGAVEKPRTGRRGRGHAGQRETKLYFANLLVKAAD